MIRRPTHQTRRGSVALFMIIILVLSSVIVTSMTLAGGRDHDLTIRRIETTQAFYAAEGAMNMAMREIAMNVDEDADGAIGTISDDANDANDPVLGGARCFVSGSPGALIRSAATSGRSDRTVLAEIASGTSSYSIFDGSEIGTTYMSFADLEDAYDTFIGVTTDEITFDGVNLNVRVTNHYRSQGIRFWNSSGALAGIREEDDQNVEPLDGYDGTYKPDQDRLYVRWPNDMEDRPFTFEFDTPVARVGSFIGMGKEGLEPRVSIKVYDSSDAELVEIIAFTDDFFEFHNREGFWGVIFDAPVIKKVTIRNMSTQNFANALVIDSIEWSATPGPAGGPYFAVTNWREVSPLD